MITVYMLMITGDLFTVEELDGDLRVTIGAHLEGLLNMNSNYFMECSVCMGKL